MRTWQRRTPAQLGLRTLAWVVGAALFAVAWQQIAQQTQWAFVVDAPRAGADIASRMFPPDLAFLGELARPLLDTLNIATLGTALALVLGVPVAVCAAHNTTPSPRIARPLALLLIVASRSVNVLIWALILVVIVGPGTLAGILAIALRSVGFVAKLTYEAIEEIDDTPVQALTSTGAPTPQIWLYGIVPQVAPAFAGLSIFRWDINVRQSTVLGFVGAGGIGLQLNAAMQALQWSRVATILLAILVAVVVSEALSARVRSAIQ
ncbi:MAG: phosphonate ABC transporter, permease protein PhnE [Myxococcales bacterium]|nr:phosphonate ABC transporter, permease protein PhnE [Myxococcales bacterium]